MFAMSRLLIDAKLLMRYYWRAFIFVQMVPPLS